ncbi:MAG: phosphotransferase [Nannocystaceae bacterium]
MGQADDFCNGRALQAAIEAVRSQGLATADARIIRSLHAILVDFPQAGLVVRVEPEQASPKVLAATRAATVLAHRNVPSVRLAHPQPLRDGTLWITLWQRLEILPQPVTASELGGLLRKFHEQTRGSNLPEIPDYSPTRAILEQLKPAHTDLHKRLKQLDSAWNCYLAETRTNHVLVHGDASLGNAAWTTQGLVLLDLENVGRGPAFCDFVPSIIAERHYGHSSDWLRELYTGYGATPDHDDGLEVLCELHKLDVGSWADHFSESSPELAREARIRLATLRGETSEPWTLL